MNSKNWDIERKLVYKINLKVISNKKNFLEQNNN